MTAQSLAEVLFDTLRAMHWSYWTAHWQSSGSQFYGDHLLFQRLYEGVLGQIDSLAEKMVATFGEESVNLARRVQADILTRWADLPAVQRGSKSEVELLKAIDDLYQAMKAEGSLTKGWDDFLMTTFDEHETNIYLLNQRSKTARKVLRNR